MTKRQRVIEALSHRQTDFVPYDFTMTIPLAEIFQRETGISDARTAYGAHITMAAYEDPWEEIRPGYFRDAFGAVWNRSGADKDIGTLEGTVISEPDPALIHLPPLDERAVDAFFADACANRGDTFLFGAIGFTLFERAWTLRGMENFLADMLLEPDFTDELLDAICQRNLKIVDIALQHPLDGFHFGDDWGQQKGLIMGPKLWRRFIGPRMARLYGRVRQAGLFVSQHSCGDISEIFPDLIDMCLQCYQTFQSEIYDAAAFKQAYGSRLAIWGGLSTQHVLPHGTPAQVQAEARRLIATLGQGGGYIAAPTHAMPYDIPVENILAMISVFQHQTQPT
nr:uroporphyrinogen decarboxylase family protein [bacterium]